MVRPVFAKATPGKRGSPQVLKELKKKELLDWTYNSNAIEGNTLTYGETAFCLRE